MNKRIICFFKPFTNSQTSHGQVPRMTSKNLYVLPHMDWRETLRLLPVTLNWNRVYATENWQPKQGSNPKPFFGERPQALSTELSHPQWRTHGAVVWEESKFKLSLHRTTSPPTIWIMLVGLIYSHRNKWCEMLLTLFNNCQWLRKKWKKRVCGLISKEKFKTYLIYEL